MTRDTRAAASYRFTVEEYHRMGNAGIIPENTRVELLAGEIIRRSPINSPHADCVDKLSKWFILNLEDQAIVRIQNPVTLDAYSEPEPDILLARWKKNGYRAAHPGPEEVLLLIEVADSSLEKDRRVKLPLYAKAGIPEVWIVDLSRAAVEVYTQPTGEEFANRHIYFPGETIDTTFFQDFPVSLIG